MSIAINYNDYLEGKLKDWMIEDASDNLPKELLLEIQNNIEDNASSSTFAEFNLWFLQRELDEDWTSVSRDRFILDKNLPKWCKDAYSITNTHGFSNTLEIEFDKIPKEITLLDMIISHDNSVQYSFENIVLDFMTIKKFIKIKYFYKCKFVTAPVIFLGTLARSDSDEWKFFPKFNEKFKNVFKNRKTSYL